MHPGQRFSAHAADALSRGRGTSPVAERADGLGRGTGSGRQEGVHDDMLVVTTDIEGRMAVPEDLAHDRSPCWGAPQNGERKYSARLGDCHEKKQACRDAGRRRARKRCTDHFRD